MFDWLRKPRKDLPRLKWKDFGLLALTSAVGLTTGYSQWCVNPFIEALHMKEDWRSSYLIYVYEYSHQLGHELSIYRSGGEPGPPSPVAIRPPGNPFVEPSEDPDYH